MKTISNLLYSIWVVTLMVILSLALPVEASGLSISPIVYGEQIDVSIAYDGASSSMFGYDSTSAHTGNERATRTRTDTAFGHVLGFLAAEGGAIRWGPLNGGPLRDTVANTFRGGSYTESALSGETTLFRSYGGTATEMGRRGLDRAGIGLWERTRNSVGASVVRQFAGFF
jgi:hypothetical protein